MKSGIYKILNTKTNKFYIGNSVDIKRRFNQHRVSLTKGVHVNHYLQRAWNKYSSWKFEFIVLEYCEEEKLLEREQFYIDTLKPEYNLFKIAGSSLGYKPSEEHKRKIGKANSGRIVSQETRDKISASVRALNYHHTEEAKVKISLASKGNKYSFGKKLSDAHKLKLSIAGKNAELKGNGIGTRIRDKEKWPCEKGSSCRCSRCNDVNNYLKNLTKIQRKFQNKIAISYALDMQ